MARTDAQRIRLLTQTGLFTAAIFVMTAFLHIPSFLGYIHAGDGVIFLAASVLPAPYAAFAGAFGAALADWQSGYLVWAPATLVIKAATVLCFTAKKPAILCRRNLLALIPAALICAAGYTVYQAIFITGSVLNTAFVTALAATPTYFLQTAISAVLFFVLARALDRMGLKNKR
ncbi:MAG: TIGR04002 family protein [Oscillospiraceae bacterium]